jgi:hypothetical protein
MRQGRQDVSDVLKDPCASTWLKNAIRTALDRDLVDAANDAEYLAVILKARARAMRIGAEYQEGNK